MFNGDTGRSRARFERYSVRSALTLSGTPASPSNVFGMAVSIAFQRFFKHFVVGDDKLEVRFCQIELCFELCLSFVRIFEKGGLNRLNQSQLTPAK